MLNSLDAAYIAGLFDGEGHTNIYANRHSKNGKRYRKIVVKISNTDKSVLEYVKKTFGFGGVFTNSKPKGNRKISYVFQVQNRGARIFLKEVLPYLKIKKSWVEKILSSELGPVSDNWRIEKVPLHYN